MRNTAVQSCPIQALTVARQQVEGGAAIIDINFDEGMLDDVFLDLTGTHIERDDTEKDRP